jgi:hypothetical protein
MADGVKDQKREKKRCKVGDREKDTGKKEGNDKDREKAHEKIDEKEVEESDIDTSDTISINDFLMLMILKLRFAGCKFIFQKMGKKLKMSKFILT